MYRSIMVPLDGSVFSEHALPLALSIARRAGATLQLAHVHIATSPLYDATGLPSLDGRMDAAAREPEHEYLVGMAQRLAADWELTVTATLLDEEASVAATLHHHAVASGCDLIVMTTNGRGGVARMWLGSIADKLVRQAPMPVLLVRPHTEALDLLDLTREQVVKQILIPLDGSTLAEAILEPAVALGAVMHAECTLLQAINPVVADDAVDRLVRAQDEQLLAHWQTEARVYLQRMAEGIHDQGLAVRTIVVVGPAAEAILSYSREHLVDLIAMATHGQGGITRLLAGSVAEQVVRGAGVPVLVHRPDGATPSHDAASSEARFAQGAAT